MNNIIVITHDGGELSLEEQKKVVTALVSVTHCDSETVQLSQLTRDEAIAAIAANVVLKTEGKVVATAESAVDAAIRTIQGVIALGGRIPAVGAFGIEIARILGESISSKSKKHVAFKNAIHILATEDVDLDSKLCREVGLTQFHILEIQKADKYFAHFML